MLEVLGLFICLFLLASAAAEFQTDAQVQLKVLQAIARFDAEKIPVNRRALSVYYLGNVNTEEDSLDVIENNLKIYASAVRAHNTSESTRRAFYIFSVAAGSENVLAKYLPYDAEHVAFMKTPVMHNDLLAHVQTVSMLGETIVSKFQSIFFMNHDARGPFIGRKNGQWWKYLNANFDGESRVGLVGPLISCQVAPHVQTHAFVMRSDVVMEIFADFNPRSAAGKRNRARHIETALSTEAVNAGYQLASIFDQRRYDQRVFNGTCVPQDGNNAQYRINPTSWCGVKPTDAIFMKWGGPPLRIKGYYCQDVVDSIRAESLRIAAAEGVTLALPETIYGGKMHALHKEHDEQLWMNRTVRAVPVRPRQQLAAGTQVAEASLVCLIVRTSKQQGRAAHRNTRTLPTDVSMLVESLLRQSNPNWEAYFIVTDNQPYEEELQETLKAYGDYRLNYLPLDMRFRPKYEVREAGYTATDQALRMVQKNTQCKWLSITNGDNIYGSDVFKHVLEVRPSQDTKKLPDVMLSPLDSRNYADQDYTRKRIAMDRHDAWDLRCGFLENELSRFRYGYAMTPWPTLGGLDLAGLFMDREKFISTGVYFSQFSDPQKYICPGCQDGYFISEVMTVHKWSLHRMPIVKYSSLIFHGPSPLWCIAGGNVWFDHPGKTVCLSHHTVGHLYPDDRYDWESYYQGHGQRICLRMSASGFANMSTAIIT